MFDTTSQIMQRTRGRASVGVALRGMQTRLQHLHQSGSAKAMLPNVYSSMPEVVFLNTAGGLTGGDNLEFSVTAGKGTSVIATTQTAERVYASASGVAQVDVTLKADAGAILHWLPQETILFDHGSLDRSTDVHLANDAQFLGVETIVLGRAAMGETVEKMHLLDRRRIFRAGQPIMIEPVKITSGTLQDRHNCATLASARAFTTIVFCAQGAEDVLVGIREVLPDDSVAAASAWDGKCVVRIMADDAFPLRHATARVLEKLRVAPLPRVWQM
ncbi:urease accessory protein UreD [Parasulfitobacter algicola]|uniref:Urease accessory protein UreD n=1 Tax=Parasulfitobacter algicola TaxID=2614809 RepID=A0ABX2IPB3_9RHOB|nr:urease accessory protein UreD [Sulfitobacter algicola]NSX54390.1 urease accessory protein UreD [Sulfitobacter algicola]